mgnify:CR=1 FL=1
MSDTPRTDEAEKNSDMANMVPAWFARQLERELASAQVLIDIKDVAVEYLLDKLAG